MANFKTYKYKYEKQNHFIEINLPSIFLFIIFLQIIFGAFVSGMDAGKIYNTWPLMGNNYFPDDNIFSNLFNLNALSDPSLVQFIHRNLAYLILFIFSIILYFVIKDKLLNFYNIIKIIRFTLLFQIIFRSFNYIKWCTNVFSIYAPNWINSINKY